MEMSSDNMQQDNFKDDPDYVVPNKKAKFSKIRAKTKDRTRKATGN